MNRETAATLANDLLWSMAPIGSRSHTSGAVQGTDDRYVFVNKHEDGTYEVATRYGQFGAIKHYMWASDCKAADLAIQSAALYSMALDANRLAPYRNAPI